MQIDKNFFLVELAKICESEALEETELLLTVPGWDSLGVLGYIAMVKETYGVIIPVKKIETAKTVGDLIVLAEEQIFNA